MSGLRFLVTGAAGFMGSFLVEKLLSMGYRVVGLDNLSTGRLENLVGSIGNPMFRFVKADLLDPSTWNGDLFRVDVVFHMAANPEVRHSTREPIEHYHQNLTATMNALEASRRSGVGVFVFASSSTVYGDPEAIPTPETHPIKPISVYGATKAAGEILCQTYSRLYGIRCLVLRYANIVGPRLRHGVIYDFIQKLSRDREGLEILGDGSQRKSYLYINDAVEASIAALEKILSNGAREEIYNIGNRDWITVTEIADEVIRAMGLSNIKYIYKPAQDGRGWPGDVKLMLLDISKIERETGWKPSMSSREAVRKTVESLAKLSPE
ncbi:MAG: NAD-dependent epimerase/dehydratase family protein [Desulfurococcales archaeon]|jgi:UDP-glucose 4-epimerase|nr:NAD-dependent epimerase/dehydratase family protein [Desulfurococcales archaeon]